MYNIFIVINLVCIIKIIVKVVRYLLLDLNLYKVSFIVSKYKNISHASEVLYVSQPAVSKSISELRASNSMKKKPLLLYDEPIGPFSLPILHSETW